MFRLASCIVCSKTYLSTSKLHRVLCHPGRKQLILLCSCGFGFKIGDGRTSFLATPHRNHCGTLPSLTSSQIKSIVDYVYRNDDGRGVVVDIDGLFTTKNSSILSRVSAEKAEVHKTCEKAPPKLKKCFPSCKSDSFSTTNLSIPSHAVPEKAQVLKGCNKTLLEQKKYFPCAICARNFNRRANLLRHYTLKHSNKEEEIVWDSIFNFMFLILYANDK